MRSKLADIEARYLKHCRAGDALGCVGKEVARKTGGNTIIA
jgi:hypothetical protein